MKFHNSLLASVLPDLFYENHWPSKFSWFVRTFDFAPRKGLCMCGFARFDELDLFWLRLPSVTTIVPLSSFYRNIERPTSFFILSSLEKFTEPCWPPLHAAVPVKQLLAHSAAISRALRKLERDPSAKMEDTNFGERTFTTTIMNQSELIETSSPKSKGD